MRLSVLSLCSGRAGADQSLLYAELLEQIELAEKLGFESFWLGEHHFSEWGTIRNILLMLAAASQRTTRIRLGSGVVVLPLHHPLRVAEEAAMVDRLSGGRLELGVGRGARPHELAGYGIPYEQRRSYYDEAIAVLDQAWSSSTVTYSGERFKVTDVRVLPVPTQIPSPPIWEAVSDAESVRRAAERGHNLLLGTIGTGGREATAEAAKLFKRVARENGHANTRVGVSEILFLAPTDADRAEGLRYLRRHFGDGPATQSDPLRPPPQVLERFLAMSDAEVAKQYAIETPARLIERMKSLQAMSEGSIDLLIAVPQFGEQSMQPVRRTLELLSSEVAPALA